MAKRICGATADLGGVSEEEPSGIHGLYVRRDAAARKRHTSAAVGAEVAHSLHRFVLVFVFRAGRQRRDLRFALKHAWAPSRSGSPHAARGLFVSVSAIPANRPSASMRTLWLAGFIGIVIGALLAATLAGRLQAISRPSLRAVLASVIGGLMMGYASRLAYGCNIGAFFSGVASTSLHGWVWIVAALAGNWLGVKLRPWFGLAP